MFLSSSGTLSRVHSVKLQRVSSKNGTGNKSWRSPLSAMFNSWTTIGFFCTVEEHTTKLKATLSGRRSWSIGKTNHLNLTLLDQIQTARLGFLRRCFCDLMYSEVNRAQPQTPLSTLWRVTRLAKSKISRTQSGKYWGQCSSQNGQQRNEVEIYNAKITYLNHKSSNI